MYEGEWVYDQKEGNGTMKYPNGKEYKGQWKRNEYHGTGALTYTSGTIVSYTGEWQYHRKTGSGVLKLANGDSYEGHFKDNFVSSPLFIFPFHFIILTFKNCSCMERVVTHGSAEYR